MTKIRCDWPGEDSDYVRYHDEEWGVPVYDDKTHFEFLILEGAQAGLSWITILKRREGYKRLYKNFDPAVVAEFSDEYMTKMLEDKGIIRNKLKVRSSVKNAKVFLDIQKEVGSFDDYVWAFKEAEMLAKDLKKRGMKFIGPTTIYAYMQAAGMVCDHEKTCFAYQPRN